MQRQWFEDLDKYNIYDDLSDQGQVIWKAIKTYYQQDHHADYVNRNLLAEHLSQIQPRHAEMLCGILDSLEPTSGPNVTHLVLGQRLETVKTRLSQAFASGKDGDIELLLEQYQRLQAGEIEASDQSEILIAPDLEAIMKKRSAENRIKILPMSLNSALEGGALRGHHIVLFAVTDMGKTLFTLNMVRGFIESGLKVLYVGNEDPVSDLIERFLVSLSGRDKFTVRKQWRQAQAYANKHGWENLVWAELSPGTLGEIRSLIEEHKPDVLVVDQIRNLDTGDKNFVRVLEVAAQGMRNFAKKYNLLSISVTQAGDSASGKSVLNRGDIDNSNVGIPGTADLMLGIGATEDDEFQGFRTLSFPKNKISGNKNPVGVHFNTKTMRVE